MLKIGLKGLVLKFHEISIDHLHLMSRKIPHPPFRFTLNLPVKGEPSFSLIDSRLLNGHFRHSSTPESCLQHSTYAFMLFISILTLTKQWRQRKMEKNDERLRHFEKENWYLIPIIKINWHFPSPTHGSCVQFVFQSLCFPITAISQFSIIGIYQLQLESCFDWFSFYLRANIVVCFQSRKSQTFAVSDGI